MMADPNRVDPFGGELDLSDFKPAGPMILHRSSTDSAEVGAAKSSAASAAHVIIRMVCPRLLSHCKALVIKAQSHKSARRSHEQGNGRNGRRTY
jgi:hypothetical protein